MAGDVKHARNQKTEGDQTMTTKPNYHRVTVDLDSPINGVPEVFAHCDAPKGTKCRMWCKEGCEDANYTGHNDHEIVDVGHCLLVEWLGIEVTTELFTGDTDEPFRDGPIVIEWGGECYTWDYAADLPERPEPAPEPKWFRR